MAYTPTSNEYPIQTGSFAGFPSVEAAYLRVFINDLSPGNKATLQSMLLDASGSAITGYFDGVYNISGLTSFNNTLKTLVTTAAAAKGIKVL